MIKKYLLLVLVCELFFAQANLAFAASSTYDYSKAGVSKQIEDYLCAPPKNTADKSQLSGSLYNCINRLYRFALILSSVIAVFFIVIAGYLYMSAEGNQEAVDKAKSILTSSITALVILFTGYILLKAINPDLVQFKSIQPPSVTGVPIGGTPSGTLAESDARNLLSSNSIGVNANAPQTQLQGIRQTTIDEIISLKKACNCQVTITGGTEPGHSETGTCTHANGNKFDLSMVNDLTNYIPNNLSKLDNRSDGAAQWKNPSGGAIYAQETTQGTAAHWDVAVCQ
jgi:hypothetical protein